MEHTMANHTTSTRNPTEERAMILLGTGLGPEIVANATGVSVSRISQLLSDPEFASGVSELRFQNLQKHNERDNKYDALEDRLLDQLEQVLPMCHKPMELSRMLQTINGAKRRGASAPTEVHNTAVVVSITLPSVIVQKFTTNVNNQVISAGTQDLVTVQSSAMDGMVAASATKMLETSQ
jgi:hypothetical protein